MAQAYGAGYDPHRYESAADIAKRMRADIKAAVAAGELPAAPKYSVRVENYSGGRSIDINVLDWPSAWQQCDGYKPGHGAGSGRPELCTDYFCAPRLELLGEQRPGSQPHEVLTVDARAALKVLEAIHGAYNYNRSDSMVDHFDVNFYGSVSFETASQARSRAAESAKRDARRRAVDSAAAAGPTKRVVVYGSGGRKRTVHDAIVTDSGALRLVCGATLWRSSLTGDGTGRELSCTRCVKRAEKAAAPAQPQRPRRMFEYEFTRGNPRFPSVPVAVVRCSIAPDDSRLPLVFTGGLVSGVTHYRPAGAGDWLEL